MQRISTTVIGLVGEGARACAEELGRASNIRVELPDPAAAPLERATAAWRAATGTRLPYLVHDADPLALVADAWVRRSDEQGPAGELEVAIGETAGRWRARTIELPDYYLLLDPASWTPTRRHWYLGLLHRAAPNRVVPVPADATAGKVGAKHRQPGQRPLVAGPGPAPGRRRPGRPRPGLTAAGQSGARSATRLTAPSPAVPGTAGAAPRPPAWAPTAWAPTAWAREG